MSDPSDQVLRLSVPVIDGNEWEYIRECLDSGWVSTAGPFVTRFEEKMREITGARYAVACQSGTAALHVSLLVAGIGAGDAVICPTVTFIATANAISYTGARPVLIGCDEFMNLDAAAVERFLAEECDRDGDGTLRDRTTGLRVRAMMPVHVFGNPCDMVRLKAIADDYGLVVVEDAAESLGSRWTSGPLAGKHTGTVGLLGAFSFNGNKVVTCGGGGCIVTDDEALAARCKHLTTTAKVDTEHFIHDEVGYNYRLTNMSAALGLAQLEQLDKFVAAKKRNHALYEAAVSAIDGLGFLGVPEGTEPNYWFCSVLIDRDVAGVTASELMAILKESDIETRPLWHLVHRQAPYALDHAYAVESAEALYDRVLNVPCSSDLTASDIDRVASALRRGLAGGEA